jgi:hypothetical protein
VEHPLPADGYTALKHVSIDAPHCEGWHFSPQFVSAVFNAQDCALRREPSSEKEVDVETGPRSPRSPGPKRSLLSQIFDKNFGGVKFRTVQPWLVPYPLGDEERKDYFLSSLFLIFLLFLSFLFLIHLSLLPPKAIVVHFS